MLKHGAILIIFLISLWAFKNLGAYKIKRFLRTFNGYDYLYQKACEFFIYWQEVEWQSCGVVEWQSSKKVESRKIKAEIYKSKEIVSEFSLELAILENE